VGLFVISKPQLWGVLGPSRAIAPQEEITLSSVLTWSKYAEICI